MVGLDDGCKDYDTLTADETSLAWTVAELT